MADGTFRQGDRLASLTIANGNNTDHIQKVALADSTGAAGGTVQGNVAHDAVDSGSPVKLGGVAIATGTQQTLVAAGDRVNAAFNRAGAMHVSGGLVQAVDANSAIDFLTFPEADNGSWYPLAAGLMLTTGAGQVQARGNLDTAALITATGATTSQAGADQTNVNGRGLQVVLDMTTVGTGSVTLTIQGKDAASGKYYTLLAGAAVTTNSTNLYTVYPGAPTTANVSASLPLPHLWRVITTANNANATTYKVGASVIV